METLENRIARLEAIKEIEALSTHYCLTCDAGDLTGLAELFDLDAVLEIPVMGVTAIGRDAIAEAYTAQLDAIGTSLHWTHDRLVRMDDDAPLRSAKGVVLAHAEVVVGEDTCMAAMRYEDRYCCGSDGRWRFAHRIIHFLYYMPLKEYGAHFGNADRNFLAGNWLPGAAQVTAGF